MDRDGNAAVTPDISGGGSGNSYQQRMNNVINEAKKELSKARNGRLKNISQSSFNALQNKVLASIYNMMIELKRSVNSYYQK